MAEQKRRLSWGQIVAIGVIAVVASASASYLVQRFALGKPHPQIQVAVLVGTMVPLIAMLLGRRKS